MDATSVARGFTRLLHIFGQEEPMSQVLTHIYLLRIIIIIINKSRSIRNCYNQQEDFFLDFNHGAFTAAG